MRLKEAIKNILDTLIGPAKDNTKLEKAVMAQILRNQITIMESLCGSIANNEDDLINNIMCSTDMYNAIR